MTTNRHAALSTNGQTTHPDIDANDQTLSVSVPGDVLYGARLFAATEDFRHYLNYPTLQIKQKNGQAHARVVGTNGHVLFIHRLDQKHIIGLDRFARTTALISIPLPVTPTASQYNTFYNFEFDANRPDRLDLSIWSPSGGKYADTEWERASQAPLNATECLEAAHERPTTTFTEWSFPDVDRVIPEQRTSREATVTTITWNTEYLKLINTALRALAKRTRWEQNTGKSPADTDLAADFRLFGTNKATIITPRLRNDIQIVIMPCR